MDTDRTTRRGLLRTGSAVAAAVSIAGCLETPKRNQPADGPTAESETDERDPELEVNGRFLSSAFPIELVEPDFETTSGFAGDARIAYVHWHGGEHSHWHQSPLEIEVGETRSGRTRFLEEGAEEISISPEETFSQDVYPAEGESDDHVTATVDGAFVDIEADTSGECEIVFELLAGGERRWRSPPLPVEVR